MNRRSFLKTAGAVFGALIAAPLIPAPSLEFSWHEIAINSLGRLSPKILDNLGLHYSSRHFNCRCVLVEVGDDSI